MAAERVEYDEDGRRLITAPIVPAAMPTWPFAQIITSHTDNGCDYRIRLALRVLEDVGLLSIELGPRGVMTTAKAEWLPRALLAPKRFDPDEEEAMELLG
ncbi:hypothetical protein M2171_002592 [Bradyrhizobium japonicum USDA 38]|uniref:hypothetical protein n=1 Tax=Bradyrhizobium japonicum TaxID=375 RepID=UPI00042458A4|nr:hypothetical protein [Bradyrhizobium japonicum]MCS3893459.1 hypothetical protein [Bradyrhizobium japonicum USDA 38]MCS3945973.1 hypothetical protein [Bradyrhizobium japonicum]